MPKMSVQRKLRYKMFVYENAVHDIKTPLMLVMTFMNSLNGLDNLPDQTNEYISKIRIQLGKINRVLMSCDEETRLLNDSDSDKAVNCNILTTLEEVMNVTSIFAEQRGVYIKLHSDVFYAVTFINRGYLDKILTNLLINAIKFTDPGKTVTLSLKSTEKNLIVSVKDEGEGIPEDKLADIFKRYYSLNDVNNPHGAGIGLSIVKEYTKRIGGKITVTSEVGKGSVFKLNIPRIYRMANDDNELNNDDASKNIRQSKS